MRVKPLGLYPRVPFLRTLMCVFILSLACVSLHAQTATTGQVVGRVTDPSGAAIPAARVTLVAPSTNTTLSKVADSTGHYAFPVVSPGQYVLTVDKTGFQTSTITGIVVQVTKSDTVNVQMKVGAVTQSVTVAATAGVELQTTNASVGNELSTASLENLPQISRDASALMFLQPAVAPATNSTGTGGQIAGALSEQVTYTLDGGDATSDLEGTNSYPNTSSPFSSLGPASSSSVIPNPISTTQEFRVVTAGQGASFSLSGGGEITVLTKRGTNAFHGEAYEYHDDDALNANSWQNDATRLAKPHAVDNRFGANIGGPFSALFGPAGKPLRNRAWFFFGWEEHRFNNSATLSRLVPTASLMQGIMQFKDAAGNVNSYSLVPGSVSSNCGPAGASLCDPRNKGMSPVVASQLALYKNLTHNDPSLGDGLNTTGYTFNLPLPVKADIGVARLDFTINPKWSFFTTYHLAKDTRADSNQVNIVSSPPSSASALPDYPSMLTYELTGQLTPSFTNVFHGSYTRNWWGYARTVPAPFVSGTTQAIQLAGEGVGNLNSTQKLLADPINLNAQNARQRVWDGHDWYLADDMSWVHGRHLIQFGASGYINNQLMMTDFPFGSLAGGPILDLEAKGNSASQAPGNFLSIGSQYEPPACSSSVTASCLPASQIVTFNELYASVLGLVDRAAQTGVLSGADQPLPYGTLASATPSQPALYTYFQDTWQMTPDLTGVIGLEWGAQFPFSEPGGKIPILVDAVTGQPLNATTYLSARKASLEQQGVSIVNGQVNAYNPLIGIDPTNFIPGGGPLPPGQGMVGDWHNFAPRLSLAWNVPYHNWLFGGNKQTVIRGGYSIVYDRITGSSAIFPSVLGGYFGNTYTCGGPVVNGTCSGAGTTPTTAFRIGVDGNKLPIPPVTPLPVPYVPVGTQAQPFGAQRVSQINPWATPARSHVFTLSVQRALPGHMLIELGYIGRFSRGLQEVTNLSAVDFRMKDAKSGQTIAQAFDGVAQALRNGAAVPDEPFFDNLIGLSTCQGKGFANCSAMVASQDRADLINGSLGGFQQTFNFDTPGSIDNLQYVRMDVRGGIGVLNYNAGYASLQKSFSGSSPIGGLSFQLNWTWSHATGIYEHQQQDTGALDSPYAPYVDYGNEPFDRRHVISAWYTYPLPFGKGQWHSFSNSLLNRALGGWTFSGVYTFETGLPDCIGADGDFGAADGFGTCAIPANGFDLNGASGSTHTNVPGSSGIGTRGFGLNLFANPAAVYQNVSRPLLSSPNPNTGFGNLRDPINWNWDFEINKNIAATERYKFIFAADLLNAFNHPTFGAPSMDLASPSSFGTYSAQNNQPRDVQLSLRIQF